MAGAVATSPRQRAIDAAIAHARRISFDVRSADVEAGDEPGARPHAWSGRRDPVDGAFPGKTYWIVHFAPRDASARGGDLTVLVEDGTFQVLGAIGGKEPDPLAH
jgi:hypothetical protein